MKKLIGILMFATALMAFSCEKEPEPEPGNLIPKELNTLADFAGKWEFVNFNSPHTGNETTCPSHYEETHLSFEFKGTTCTITDMCTNTVIAKDWGVTYDPPTKTLDIRFGISLDQRHIFKLDTYDNGTMVLYRRLGTSATGGFVETRITVKKVIN